MAKVAQRGIAVLEIALVGDEQSGSRGVEILHGIAVVPLHAARQQQPAQQDDMSYQVFHMVKSYAY